MRTEIDLVAIGHLPIHFDSLARSLRRRFRLYCVRWTPTNRFGWTILPCLVIRLLRAAVRHKARILVAQYAFPDGIVAAIVARLLRRPYFVQVVGSDIRLLSRGVKLALTSWVLTNATGVICVSKDLERRTKMIGARRTQVIPTPVDLSIFVKECDVYRQSRLVTVANLVPLKAIDVLIKALSKIPRTELIVIGEGPERERLERLSKELGLEGYVRFTGFISQEEVAKYLQSSSIFVLPSLTEGVPRSILEAMACGMFIIATRVGGIPDVVTEGRNGFLIEPSDVHALYEAIRRALKSPELVRSIGEENRRSVGKYDVEMIGRRIADFIERATDMTARS